MDIEEENILKKLISQNYFYFDSAEKSKILSNCFDIMADEYPNEFDKKFDILYENFYSFISSNKYLILNGFINFRLKKYFDLLDNILNEAVNQFIIEKEYLEFISLLKMYVNSQACRM